MANAALYLWCLGFGIVTFDLALTFELGSFTIKSFYFLFLLSGLLTLPIIWKRYGFWHWPKSLFNSPWIYIFLVFLYGLFTAPFAEIPKKSLVYSAWLFFDIFVVAIGGSLILRTLPRKIVLKTVRWTIILSSITLCLILVADHLAYFQGYKSGWIGYNQDRILNWGLSRPHAFSYEPSYLAMYLSLCSPFLFSWLLRAEQTAKERFGAALALSLVLFSLYLLSSRLGWATTGLCLILISFLERRRLHKKIIFVSIGAALLTVAAAIAFSPKSQSDVVNHHLISGMVTGKDGSGHSRLYFMKQSIAALEQSSYLGVGLGGSYSYVMRMHGMDPPYDLGAEAIMSIWGQLLAELGLFGVIAYLAFVASLLWTLWQSDRSGATGNALFVSCLVFFGFTAHWVGNVARTDVWVWITLWHALAQPRKPA